MTVFFYSNHRQVYFWIAGWEEGDLIDNGLQTHACDRRTSFIFFPADNCFFDILYTCMNVYNKGLQ